MLHCYLPVVLIMILMALPIQVHNSIVDSNKSIKRLTIIGVATLDLATRSFKSITTPSCCNHSFIIHSNDE